MKHHLFYDALIVIRFLCVGVCGTRVTGPLQRMPKMALVSVGLCGTRVTRPLWPKFTELCMCGEKCTSD